VWACGCEHASVGVGVACGCATECKRHGRTAYRDVQLNCVYQRIQCLSYREVECIREVKSASQFLVAAYDHSFIGKRLVLPFTQARIGLREWPRALLCSGATGNLILLLVADSGSRVLNAGEELHNFVHEDDRERKVQHPLPLGVVEWGQLENCGHEGDVKDHEVKPK